MTKPLNELTITEAAKGLRAKDFSVRELWDACHTVAQERNTELNAYLELFDADTAAIDAAQTRIDTEGENAPLLCGVPLAIKDNILIEGHIASAASKMLQNYKAPYSATVIEKLKTEGALFLGRTNMDEFAMGGSTENSAFGPARNPYDTARVPGGTSGGSAAAVAAHMGLAALGSDTGGSIRQPAGFCGVVGLKPTYGSVSRSGLIAMTSSYDQIGPVAKTVEDSKILHDAIHGIDPMDLTSIASDEYSTPSVPEKFRIGVPRALLTGMDPDMKELFESTLSTLSEQGHTIVDIELPMSAYALPMYYVIMFAEASTNLSRFDGIRYGTAERGETLLADYELSRSQGFGPEVQRRILLGTYVLSAGYIDAYYRKADAAREVLRQEYATAFKNVDVVALPTSPSPAWKLGEKSDPVSMYLEDIFTVHANLTGIPVISVPMGTLSREGKDLPAGIQFAAPHGAEELLFKIGAEVTGEKLY
ncbi:MAG: gatA [Parcubacteria group bacterium]|nr:gatA [Parcubacteria group bacterium]